MIGLLQRVTTASVSIEQEIVAKIDRGLLVLVGIEKDDTEQKADHLLERLLNYRVFPDKLGKMNLGLSDINGDLLLVPQFTLPADTKKGLRPGFSKAAPPDQGRQLFNYLSNQAKKIHTNVATGVFGSKMKVSLVNDGPVTFWLQT